MQHRLCVLLFCCLAFVLVAPAQQSEKPLSIVVYNLEAQGVAGSTADIMTSSIVAELSASNKLFVRDEKTTIAVLKEKGMAQTDYCDAEKCRIDTAKLIKADRVVIGNIGKMGEIFVINIRVADVNGRTVYAQKQRCEKCGEGQLLDIVEIMARNIRSFLETGKKPESEITTPPVITPPVTPPGPTPPVTPQAGAGSIKITTNPPGAEVFLDAQPVGKTPLTISSISAGIHELTITHQGHSTLTKSVEVSAGKVATVNEILSRQTGAIEVQSNPSGADFWVDGKYIGKTPKKVPGVLVGKHAVKVVLGNYQDFTTESNVEINETASVKATLQGLPGRILVTSTPDGADVFADGNKVGISPYSGQVAPGPHQIRIGKEGYKSAEQTIEILPNKPKTINIILKKGDDVFRLSPDAGKNIRTLKGQSDGVRYISFSPDGKILAYGGCDRGVDNEKEGTGCGKSSIKLLDVKSEKIIQSYESSGPVSSVSFTANGNILAWGGCDGSHKINTGNSFQPFDVACDTAFIKLLDVNQGKIIRKISVNYKNIKTVSFSPDGKILASGGSENANAIKLWNTSSGELIRTLYGHSSSGSSVSFSPDGKILASGSYDKTIILWDVSTGNLIRTLTVRSSVYSVSFSPDGKILASGDADYKIKQWDVSTGNLIRTLTARSNVYSVSFSPDGKILASGSLDKTIILWDVSTGKLIRTLQGHSALVECVSFSPDGKILASGSYDKTIKFWSIFPEPD